MAAYGGLANGLHHELFVHAGDATYTAYL